MFLCSLKIKFFLLFFLFNFLLFSQKLDSIQNGKNIYFENLFQVNNVIYRSEQPSKIGIKELEKLGIKSILNLRNIKNDHWIIRHSNLFYFQERINAWTMTENQLIIALSLLKNAEKPVLIHCVHGSDRTGTVIAAYRILFENWTKEAAIKELLESQYGFHSVFENLILLLNKLDIEKSKIKLEI